MDKSGCGALKQRAFDRLAVEWVALIRRADGHCVKVVLRDISMAGASFSCRAHLPIGSRAELILPDGDSCPVRIIWQLGQTAGLEFTNLLRYDRLMALAARNEDHAQALARCA